VGEHRDLLAYLVRRLLENGANSSFVHQLADASVDVQALLASPLHPANAPALPRPVALYGFDGQRGRKNSGGVDLACLAEREPLERAMAEPRADPVATATNAQVDAAMQRLHAAFPTWTSTPLAERAQMRRHAADALGSR